MVRPRFTPSLMGPDVLERLLVDQRLLDTVMNRVVRAVATAAWDHTHLIGPRGAGKSHLVALVHRRTTRLRETGSAVQVAWLPEDPYTLGSYRHLLASIAERCEPRPVDRVPVAAADLEAYLTAAAARAGPIVVLVENLDQILAAWGADEQQRLRHLLERDHSLLLVATSTRDGRGLGAEPGPFDAFIATSRLPPLDESQAVELLIAIAREDGQIDVAAHLRTPGARARVRALAQLAGGQPRVWSILASSVSVAGLDDLVDLVLTGFDDLTPYVQEQLARLSGQQRLVVAELGALGRPINVKDLAARLDVDQRSLGKTMSDLVARGWVAPVSSALTAGLVDRRLTFYELSDPVARVTMQLRQSRGERVRAIVEFLRRWFDPAQPDGETDGASDDAPAVALLEQVDDALAALARGDATAYLALPTTVRLGVEQRGDTIRRDADAVTTHVPGRARELEPAGELVESRDPAETLIAHCERRYGADHAVTRIVRSNLTDLVRSLGQLIDALGVEEEALHDRERRLGPDHLDTMTARDNLAISYAQLGGPQRTAELREAVQVSRAHLRR